MTQLLTVQEIFLYEWPFTLRLPFRFGVVTVTEGRQAVVRVRIGLPDGREGWGVAAETLAAKWFDKNPALSDEQNRQQLRDALVLASDIYGAQGFLSAFDHSAEAYQPMLEEGAARGLPPLAAAFGPALLDRAIADALGRLEKISFYELVERNVLGIEPVTLARDLAGFDAGKFLPKLRPATHLLARHTVGMVDPIGAGDQAGRVADGLPETLDEVIAVYGQRYFKLKLGGDLAADLDRLGRIAGVLDGIDQPYHVTLDGNEQYNDAAGVLELLRGIEAAPGLARLRKSLLFVEQPIKRAVALACDVSDIAAICPIIIDESDGEIGSFVRAIRLGYTGVSSKNCKGFYKSLINRMRCVVWNEAAGEERYFMSAEDLTTLAGVSVQQDLALVALLGLGHVERNGHHFVDGFNGRPAAEAEHFLAAHPDLYHRMGDHVRLRIAGGRIAIGSLACTGFAVGCEPDFEAMEPMQVKA
jgi:L-alanine-DL-glutamate epimerase-like enolase superfamily enzyme